MLNKTPKPIVILDNLGNPDFLDTCKLLLKRKSGIYSFRNKVNQMQYIGKSINLHRRVYLHLNAPYHSNDHLQNAFLKYGLGNFELLIYEFTNLDNLTDLEIKYITSFSPDLLYNYIVDESDLRMERINPKLTEERIAQIVAARKKAAGAIPFQLLPGFKLNSKGEVVTIAEPVLTVDNLPLVLKGPATLGFTGRRHSDESKSLIARPGSKNSMFGKTHSAEAKQKMAAKRNARSSPNGVGVFDLNDRLVGKFASNVEVANHFQSSKPTISRYVRQGKVFKDNYIIKKL